MKNLFKKVSTSSVFLTKKEKEAILSKALAEKRQKLLRGKPKRVVQAKQLPPTISKGKKGRRIFYKDVKTGRFASKKIFEKEVTKLTPTRKVKPAKKVFKPTVVKTTSKGLTFYKDIKTGRFTSKKTYEQEEKIKRIKRRVKEKAKKPSLPAHIKALQIAKKYAPKDKRKEISEQIERAFKELKEEVLHINLKAPLTSLNIETATIEELEGENARLISEQQELGQMLDMIKTERNRKLIKAQLRRYARLIMTIETKLDIYEKPRGFKEKKYEIGKNIEVYNEYLWDGKQFLNDLIDSGDYDIFVIGGLQFVVDEVVDIYSAFDDLYTEAEMHGIYYFQFTVNDRIRKVTVSILY